MQNILFRADSSSTIGTGHIMRDMVLAEQFKDANIIFATQNFPGNINDKIEEKCYKIEILGSNNIEEVIGLIKKHTVNTIVIDHYSIDYNYEKELKEKTGVMIFVLDDTYEKHYCDILLNHNISADPNKYRGLVPESCEIRCGAKYTLLRDEFKVIKMKRRDISDKKILTAFIAMGGADHSNINIAVLDVINKFDNINASVVTTRANRHLKDLEEYARDHINVTVYINTDKIALLMNESDFAIVTPSVTVNEVIFMQLPFIAIKTADNQNDIATYIDEHNLPVLYDFEEKTLANAIDNLIQPERYNEVLTKIDTFFTDEDH